MQSHKTATLPRTLRLANERDRDGQKSLTSDVTYTLLERKDGEARIGIDGKLSDGRMSGRLTGNLNVDLAGGWTTSMNLQMNLSGVVQGDSRKLEATFKYTPQ